MGAARLVNCVTPVTDTLPRFLTGIFSLPLSPTQILGLYVPRFKTLPSLSDPLMALFFFVRVHPGCRFPMENLPSRCSL